MTRRDYELLARGLAEGRTKHPAIKSVPDFRRGYDTAVREIAGTLARTNVRFDQPRFISNSGAN